jgi:hypothetical protein
MSARHIDRRRMLAMLGMAGVGLATQGCLLADRALSRHRIVVRGDPGLETAILTGFVDAVIPGLDARTLQSPNVVRMFHDANLPFDGVRLDLSAHLCKSAVRRHDDWRFHALPARARRDVIRAGLEAGGLVSRLYTGAVFLVQAATYASIYDDTCGCSLIEYEGAGPIRPWTEMSYGPQDRLYAADGACPGGQPA